MPDFDAPVQTNLDLGFDPPNGDPDWEEVSLQGDPPWPNTPDWDEFNPVISDKGKVLLYNRFTDMFHVMGGGKNYGIHWADMVPRVPLAGTEPTGRCEGAADMKVFVTIKDPVYKAYIRQKNCMTQINVVLSYTVVEKTFKCNKALHKWRVDGAPKQYGMFRTVSSYFSCPNPGTP